MAGGWAQGPQRLRGGVSGALQAHNTPPRIIRGIRTGGGLVVIAAIPTFRTDAFIDGRFRPASSGERFDTENPATGQKLTEVAAGDAADIDLAVASGRRAFEDGRWSRRSPAERKAVLLRMADLLEANAEELAQLDSLEAG